METEASTSTVSGTRVRVARGLMALAAASALIAAISGVLLVADAEPSALMVETWRLYGVLAFAALFAVLAWRPLHYRWLWEIVLVNKVLLTLTAAGFVTGVLGPGEVDGAATALVADGALVAVVLAAYLLCQGWRAAPTSPSLPG